MSSEAESSRTRSDSVFSASENGKSAVLVAPQPSSKLKDFISKRHMQAIQKISIITYTVAVLGGLYSVLGLALLGTVAAALFGPCPEDETPTGINPYMWLILEYILATFELLLAVLLIYSVNEVRPVLNMLKEVCCSIVHCQNPVKSYATDGRKFVLSNGQFRSPSSHPQQLSDGRDFTVSTRNCQESPVDREKGAVTT